MADARARWIGAGVALALAGTALAQQAGVAGTLHNLSVSGPGEVKSLTETQVCKFCHIPHSAVVPQPLWGHRLPENVRYRTAEPWRGRGQRETLPQPDGASRLCLSCHDGTVALGDVAGEPRPIPMAGSQRLEPGRPGYIGTDLSGSHPISFRVTDQVPLAPEQDMGVKPLDAIRSDPDVRLDAEGKMQCTTCHDPHSDANYRPGVTPHFWVKPTVTEVCATCHELR